MIFTLTDRKYHTIDSYETSEYMIGKYLDSFLKTLEIEVYNSSAYADEWVEGNYIMCEDARGHKYWFTIYDAEDGTESASKKLKCYSGTIDIVAEDARPIVRPSEPQPFKYYFDKVFFDTGIVLGINQISDLKRTLEFESTRVSNAEMLQYVLNGFDNAEADIAVEFDGATPSKVILNVFKHIGHQSLQTVLSDDSNTIKTLKRIGSISDLATAVVPYGQNDVDPESPLTLAGKYYEEKDSKGVVQYFSPKESNRIYSVKGNRDFYVDIPGKKEASGDKGYINRRYESQTSNRDTLWREGLNYLKKFDHPLVEYDVEGGLDCRIGDAVQIVATKMKPPVTISARVIEEHYNDDAPDRNRYVFGNYSQVQSRIDEMSALIAKFKNQLIHIVLQTTHYAVSEQGVNAPTFGWVDSIPKIPRGQYLWTKVETLLSNDEITVAYSVAYSGIDGEQGIRGPAGSDGRTTYFHTAWANSADGSQGFSTTISEGKLYLGTATSFTSDDPSLYTAYNWTLIKGDKGPSGSTGPPTGITSSPTEPDSNLRYTGMLWRNTGTSGGRIKDATYRWTGSYWELYIFSAANISTTNLAAINANLGTVTAGRILSEGDSGRLDIDANTGVINTTYVGASIISSLEMYGGNIVTTVKRNVPGLDYTIGRFSGAEIRMEAYNYVDKLLYQTGLSPNGFIHTNGSNSRVIGFTEEGIELKALSSNEGNARNSGLELVGDISYIDFHRNISGSGDFGARIVHGHPTYGPGRLVLLAPDDDVQIQTLGHLHVKNVKGTGYRSVKATSFDSQSAYSAKTDFQAIDQQLLLEAALTTDILSFRYIGAEDESRTIGFVINDNGESPYHTSPLLVAEDGHSFSLTTAMGVLFGAVKEQHKQIKELKACLNNK